MPALEQFLEWASVAWCCALLQVEFPGFLVVLSVDFLLLFGGNCARQARAPTKYFSLHDLAYEFTSALVPLRRLVLPPLSAVLKKRTSARRYRIIF
jgi:hypothetical protein